MSTPFWDPGAKPIDFTSSPITADGRVYGPALSEWDTMTMGGQQLPGVTQLRGKKGHKLQKDSSPGTSGDTLRSLGADNAEIDIVVTIWMPAHLDAWEKVIPVIRPKKDSPEAVAVQHPALNMYGISALFVVELGLPEPGPIPGTRVITIRCTEFIDGQKPGVKLVAYKRIDGPDLHVAGQPTAAADPSSKAPTP